MKKKNLIWLQWLLLMGTVFIVAWSCDKEDKKQFPNISWQKTFGGSLDDRAYSIQQTTDEGYIIVGFSESNDGDVSGNHGDSDYWIVKLTSIGELEWQKSHGFGDHDKAKSIQQTTDGGYIIAGSSQRGYGYGSWIVKFTAKGELDWNMYLEDSISEMWANSIQQTTDGGYIIAGSSQRYSGYDYWIAKLTLTGELDWQKSLGGYNDETANSVQQTNDGGYVIAGKSSSNEGDVSGNHGSYDYWIVKLTATGELDWQNSYGGSEWDVAYSIQQTNDGGYIIAGESSSNDGDVSGNHGWFDYWIVKLTATGELDWQKSYGGSDSESAFSIQQTNDGGYIIAGESASIDGDISENIYS